MTARRWLPSRLPSSRPLATATGLGLCLAALGIPAAAGPAAAAEWTETLTAGSSVDVAADVGDVITLAGENLIVASVVVSDIGGIVLSDVSASIIPSPQSVTVASTGITTVPVTFEFGAVLSPIDIPAELVLNALRQQSISGATLQVTVAEPAEVPPPVVEPPPEVEPPPVVVDPPVEVPPVVVLPAPPPVIQPGVPLTVPAPIPTIVTAPARPTTVAVRPPSSRAPVALPTALTGTTTAGTPNAVEAPTVLIDAAAVTPAPPVDRRTQTVTRQSSSGLSSAFGVLSGFQAPSASTTATVPFGFDEVPLALGVPTLLAMLSICVAGSGLLQAESTRPRRERPARARLSPRWTQQFQGADVREWAWDQLGHRLRPAGRLRWYATVR